MANCRKDFLDEVQGEEVLCAIIYHGDPEWIEDAADTAALLKKGYSPEDFADFLNKIGYNYDSGFGGQEVFGTIWYRDGTWSERGEYDGSEWWVHKVCPDIPEELECH